MSLEIFFFGVHDMKFWIEIDSEDLLFSLWHVSVSLCNIGFFFSFNYAEWGRPSRFRDNREQEDPPEANGDLFFFTYMKS